MITPSRASEWFTPINSRHVPTEYTGGEWVSPRRGGETGATPPPPAESPVSCAHEATVEQLRSWLSRQPFDGRVVVGDVLLRLGRAPRGGA